MKDIGLKLFLASTGLVILGFSAAQTPQTQKIGSIEASDIGEKVAVEGDISDVYSSGEAWFMEISDSTGSISGVSFSGSGFTSGQALLVGRVEMYDGDLQLVIEDASVAP
ncbi:exodeoxyribonuclease VII large subunit [Candidatus Nanosalina sp. VS9-1]|uniref:exodeoxyribonuclease VII large subunit n=1 Tax=Candidatus Nanosalina sp. VS9-1 TaxID=3388566 RepID=UPI0039E041EA